MLAQLAASVIGKPSNIGLIPIASAMPAITGEKTITCAILLISSLMNMDKIVIITTKTNPSLPPKPASHLPRLSIRPAFSSAPASAIPPPNNNRIPHAIFVVSFHSRMRLPLPSMPAGAMKSAVAPIIAIIVSSSLIRSSALIRSLVIHSNAVAQKMTNTLFSAFFIGPSSSIFRLMICLVEMSDFNLFGYNHFVIVI